MPLHPKSPQTQSVKSIISENKQLINCQFWDNYKVLKCPGDGHCFFHAVVASYNAQVNPNNAIENQTLLEQIKVESTSNYDQYVVNYENESIDEFMTDMNNYICHKHYDSLFGDLVLMITSAILHIKIISIGMAAGRMKETEVSYKNQSTESNSHTYSVYVYKTGEHYDAIIRNQ